MYCQKHTMTFLTQKAIKCWFVMRILSSHTDYKTFLVVVGYCAPQEGIICRALDYFQESKEVALGTFKNMIQ